MVLIDNGRLSLDIWPKIQDQTNSTKNMMKIVWAEEAYC